MILKVLDYINKSKLPFFFSTPLPYAIGTASFQILYSYILAKAKKKKIIIIYPTILQSILKYNLCNNDLFTQIRYNNDENIFLKIFEKIIFIFFNLYFLKKRIFFLLNSKNSNFDFPSISLNLSLNIREKKSINHNYLSEIVKRDFSLGQNLNLKKKYIQECENIFKKDFDLTKEIICLHVRENSYHNDTDRRDYRNSSIQNYKKLIHFFLNTGKFNVVRLGDDKMTKLKIDSQNFFDVPSSNTGSKLDLYFIKNCKFYIGCDSGPIDTAWLFNKPVFITNMYALHTDSFPRGKFDRGILKKMFWKSTSQKISMIDFAKLNFSYHNSEKSVHEIKFEENTEEEIYINGLEFYENLEKRSYNLTVKQKNFNKIMIDNFYKYLIQNKDDKNDLINFFEAKKILELCKYNKGSLSNNFLNKNL